MEIVSGFLLWLLTDVFGVKWVRKESKPVHRVLKIAFFLVLAFISIVLFFMLFGAPQ